MKYRILLVCLGIFFEFSLHGQDSLSTIYSPSLKELTSLKVELSGELSTNVTSFKELSVRETPGIVTILTRQDIEASGMRELIDVLRLVPGIDFATDIDNIVGITVRGNWAHEGKVLILIDGMVLNENSYGTFAFGQRILLEHIEKIEIIRGPGSAIYGGLASLAVINIITKNPQNSQTTVTASYGNTMHPSRQAIHFHTYQKVNPQLACSFSGFLYGGQKSHFTVTLPNKNAYSFKDSSHFFTQQYHLKVQYKSLRAQFFQEYHNARVVNTLYEFYTKNHIADIDYSFSLGKKWVITPKLTFRQLHPWNSEDDFKKTNTYAFNTINQRTTGRLLATYASGKNISFTSGMEVFGEKATYEYPFTQFANGKRSVQYHNIAIFSEFLLQSDIVNLTVGVRYDNHSAVSPAFVPRFALTKAWKNWHVKLLHSYAFRAPTIQNINATRENESIEPERTITTEIETGYKRKNFSLSANLYQVRINQPIIFIYESNPDDPSIYNEYYANQDRSGTRGLEIEAKVMGKLGFLATNYSYYQAHQNLVAEYSLENDEKSLLGTPRHKFTFRTQLKLGETFFLNSNLIYWNRKVAYLSYDKANEDVRESIFSPVTMLNFSLEKKNLARSNIDVSLALFNLLNQRYYFVSTLNTAYVPLPDQKRELVLRLRYTLQN